VAPIPVIPLHPVVRPGETTITPVLLHQVVPVGTVFAVIPGVVVMVVAIVVPDVVVLTSFFLTSVVLPSGVGRNRHRCNKGSSQEQRTDVSMYTVHVVVLQARDAYAQNPGSRDYARTASQSMFHIARIERNLDILPIGLSNWGSEITKRPKQQTCECVPKRTDMGLRSV
jgi:hypothetical protein